MTTESSRTAAHISNVSRRSFPRSLFLSINSIALISLLGCGGSSDGPKREAVSGSVFREGIEIDSGTVTFEPESGGPAAVAAISKGRYQLDKKTGPVAGKQKVIVFQHPMRDYKVGVPKKDAEIIPDTRFKKKMPPAGWVREAEIKSGQKESIDFEVDS